MESGETTIIFRSGGDSMKNGRCFLKRRGLSVSTIACVLLVLVGVARLLS